MSTLLSSAIIVALACYSVAMMLALVRLLRGPSAQDRVLALDFLYVNGMLVMLTLGIFFSSGMYFVAALLIALFGFVSSAALAKFLLRGEIVE
jgi:multicomponent K+:H+ antiporter subunit F